MNAETSMLNVSNELQKAIELVASALKCTTNEKNLYHVNATVAKNQIQDDISSHLELLRNREVWLLEQVDVHSQLKEETLENHLNELGILLTKLKVFEELLETQELQQSQVISKQAKEVITRVNNKLLHLDEVSSIYFSADNFALSDAVKGYGAIVEGEDTQKLPWANKKRLVSKDHSREVVFIQDYFKRVASSPQKDWLIPAGENNDMRTDVGSFCKYLEELQKSDQKEWLYQECQPEDLETVSNRFREHFQQVKATPAKEWLQNGMSTEDGDNMSTAYHYTTLDTSANIKEWLQRPLEELSLSPKHEDLIDEGISLSRHSSLEDKGSKNYSRDNYIDSKGGWLLDDSAQDKSSNEQLESCTSRSSTETWLKSFREANGASLSDWLAVTESETEVKPEYCEWLTQESIDRCKSCPGECAKDNFGIFRNVLNSTTTEWLTTVSDW